MKPNFWSDRDPFMTQSDFLERISDSEVELHSCRDASVKHQLITAHVSLQGAAGALLSFGRAGQSWQAPAACAAQSGPGWPAAHPVGQDGCLWWPCKRPRSYTCKAGAGSALVHISMAENLRLKVKMCLPGLQGTGMCRGPEGTSWHCMQHSCILPLKQRSYKNVL